MKKILIFIGPPGSGKGTQAKLLVDKFGYKHISTGDLLRNLANQSEIEPADKVALEEMKAGKLVPDWLIYRLAFDEIKKNLSKGNGVVLDGTIRNVEQAQEFKKYFTKNGWENEVQAVEVAMSDEEIFNRLTNRRLCVVCGEIIPYLPATKGLNICPKCGGELVNRQDDNPEVIKNRVKEQGNATLKPIVDFYEKLGVLSKVDGSQSIEKVTKDILAVIS